MTTPDPAEHEVPELGGGRVLDDSALIDVALRRSQYALSVVYVASRRCATLVVPSTSIALAASRLPAAAHADLRILLHLPNTVISDLTSENMWRVAQLLEGQPPHPAGALPAAHAVDCATSRGYPVVTAHPTQLQALDPDVLVEQLP